MQYKLFPNASQGPNTVPTWRNGRGSSLRIASTRGSACDLSAFLRAVVLKLLLFLRIASILNDEDEDSDADDGGATRRRSDGHSHSRRYRRGSATPL